jgi:myo-inositol 2-dehydrogenase/D-chiro-inositol 1-dehydrogenase
MLEICQFGAGRIGQIHAGNVAANGRARLRYVVDVNAAAAEALAAKHGAKPSTTEAALADPAVKAVLIASSTDTHADLIEASARAGKAIFCEKPIDLSLPRVDACVKVVKQAGVPFFIGFNRRFDPHFAALRAALQQGAVGRVETVTITSRDPAPPHPAFIATSGGMFRDMMIHDFDMAHWLLGQVPVEVFAYASCLVDPMFSAAGDVDTAVVVMKTAEGVLCQITNSRRAVYGYDQRIEVFGSAGMLQAGNVTPTTVSRWGADGVVADKPLPFFLQRYAGAYRAELDHFIDCCLGDAKPVVQPEDGRIALVIAEAAVESVKRGGPVKV